MQLKILPYVVFMMQFQKVPMALMQKSVYSCDTIDFDNTILLKFKLNINLVMLKLPLNLTV